MRILFDTNILIHLEDNRVVKDKFSNLLKIINKNNCKLCYHPSSVIDINNDKNDDRRIITLSKLNKYIPLDSPALIDEDFIKRVGEVTSNDKIDNELLYQVYVDYVDILITEDKGIKRKSAVLNRSHKVLKVDDALDYLKEKFTLKIPEHPELKKLSVRDLEKDYNKLFFDSLKRDYQGFDSWFNKCKQDNRDCYRMKIDSEIFALLIFNKETAVDHRIKGIHDDVLKMCTFKVAEDALGRKIGELFLSKMFEYCIENNISYLYLTSFPKQDSLIYLLEKYGFIQHEIKENGEIIFLKNMIKPSLDKFNKDLNFPYYKDDLIGKAVVPIQQQYYNFLFKDGNLRPASLFDKTMENYDDIEGNTIDKAYISKTKIKGMKSGDLLLFYSSKLYKVVEPIGILEEIVYSDDIDEIMNLVSSRTVYEKEDISKLLKSGGQLTIFLFRLITYLDKPIPIQELRKLDSAKNNLVTTTLLTKKDYQILKDKGYFNERFIVN